MKTTCFDCAYAMMERAWTPMCWKLVGAPDTGDYPDSVNVHNKLGARLDFWSEAGAGTEVQLTVPAAVAYETSRDGAGFRLFRKARIHEHQS